MALSYCSSCRKGNLSHPTLSEGTTEKSACTRLPEKYWELLFSFGAWWKNEVVFPQGRWRPYFFFFFSNGCLVSFVDIDHNVCIHSFSICYLDCLYPGYFLSTVMNIGMQRSFGINIFMFGSRYQEVELLGFMKAPVFQFWRICHIVFHTGWIRQHSTQQWMRVSFHCISLPSTLIDFSLFEVAIYCGMRWFVFFILTSISQTIRNNENFFICLLAIHVFIKTVTLSTFPFFDASLYILVAPSTFTPPTLTLLSSSNLSFIVIVHELIWMCYFYICFVFLYYTQR